MVPDSKPQLPQEPAAFWQVTGNVQGKVQAWVLPQVGVVLGGALALQSPLTQQASLSMQLVLQETNPAAHIVVHEPAPEQVKLPPQGAGAGDTQAPAAQVPEPTRFAPEHIGVPQLPVGKEQVLLA